MSTAQKNVYLNATQDFKPVNVIQETTYTDEKGTVYTLFTHLSEQYEGEEREAPYTCSEESSGAAAGYGQTPQEAEENALFNFKRSDKYGQLARIIQQAKDAPENDRKKREAQAAKEEEENSMSEDVQEAVRSYAASIKIYYEGEDHASRYAEIAWETITQDDVKRVLMNADDLPEDAAAILAPIVDDLIKNGEIELEEETVSQYYAPARTVGYCDHGEQEEQVQFSELEKLGVPNTPAARRMVKRIFYTEDFTINNTSGEYLYAYYITGNATALILPDLKTIFKAMQTAKTNG